MATRAARLVYLRKQARESARRALYEMAANECASLSETFKAECRLSSVTLSANPILQEDTTGAVRSALFARAYKAQRQQ
jgi:hypothetical protein